MTMPSGSIENSRIWGSWRLARAVDPRIGSLIGASVPLQEVVLSPQNPFTSLSCHGTFPAVAVSLPR